MKERRNEMASDKIVILNAENFQQEVLDSEQLVVVDFWADWCGPCKMVAPVMDELAEDYDGRAKIAKLNVDEERDLAKKYRVMSIPSILFFKNGNEVDRIVGAQGKDEFASKIDSLL